MTSDALLDLTADQPSTWMHGLPLHLDQHGGGRPTIGCALKRDAIQLLAVRSQVDADPQNGAIASDVVDRSDGNDGNPALHGSVVRDCLTERTFGPVFYAGDSTMTVPGDSVVMTYDLMGWRVTARNRHGIIRKEYYPDGALKRRIYEQHGNPAHRDTVTYQYNAAGQRTLLTHGADSIRYAYDAVTGDLQTMTITWGPPSSVTRTITWSWDRLGRRRQLTYSTGLVVQYRYDMLGNVRRIKARRPPRPSLPDNLRLTVIRDQFDAAGRMLEGRVQCATLDQPGSACRGAVTMPLRTRYNRLGWLATQLDGDGMTEAMTYDAAGNIVGRQRETQPLRSFRLVPGTNRLAADSFHVSDEPSRKYLYDRNGARVLEAYDLSPWSAGEDRTWKRYFYDASGRPSGYAYMQSVTGPVGSGPVYATAGGVDSCLYDAEGKTLQACDYASPDLHYDGDNVVGTWGAGTWTFVHGPGLDDPLIGRVRFCWGVSSCDLRELIWVTDGQGRQFAVAEESGRISEDLSSGGLTGWQNAGGTSQSYGFDASRQDPNGTGIAVFRNRLYDQATGRWLQEDPIGVAGGINLYRFNGNDPVSYSDPFGLSPCPDPPCRSPDDPLKDRPLPPDVDEGDVTWDPNKRWYTHDKDGRIFRPHPEDPGHWDHWDVIVPGGGQTTYPEKSTKPRPGQKTAPYGRQSPVDPWPVQRSLWNDYVESLEQLLQDFGRGIQKWPSPPAWALPPLPGLPIPAPL